MLAALTGLLLLLTGLGPAALLAALAGVLTALLLAGLLVLILLGIIHRVPR